MTRAIGGEGSLWQDSSGMSLPGTVVLAAALSCLTGAAIVVAIGVYRSSEHRARERGLLDRVTGS